MKKAALFITIAVVWSITIPALTNNPVIVTIASVAVGTLMSILWEMEK